MTRASPDSNTIAYADYGNFIGEDSVWQTGSIKLSDGSIWEYREPEAKITVKHANLRLLISPFTRSHDSIQTLDNAKHLYFSKKSFPAAEEFDMRYEVSMSAMGINNSKDDIYDAFIAFHLLDAESGVAADFFASDENIAMAYSRPIESGPEIGKPAERRYLAVFKAIDVHTTPGALHQYRIIYSRQKGELIWILDGSQVESQKNLPAKILAFKLGIGIMTAKNINAGKSVSLHGQGMTGEWSPVRIARTET